MSNIESTPQFKSPENKDKISDIEREVFNLIVPKHKASAVRMEDFEGKYSIEEIRRDQVAIERKRSQFSQENPERHKRADIFEAILAEGIELNDWSGKNAFTITPSEYDDFFHGVDFTIEFEEEEKFKYLALDITSSAISIEKKIRRIKEGIKDGQVTKMKYLSSERNTSPGLPGPLEQLPNVVIGADVRTIVELSEILLQISKAKEMKNKEKDHSIQDIYASEIKTAKDKLARHRIQILILKELEKQLEVFSNFAKEIGQAEIAVKYQDLLQTIRDILKTKTISKDAGKINEADDVYKAIEKSLGNFDSL